MYNVAVQRQEQEGGGGGWPLLHMSYMGMCRSIMKVSCLSVSEKGYQNYPLSLEKGYIFRQFDFEIGLIFPHNP